jgi:hypothetical protein
VAPDDGGTSKARDQNQAGEHGEGLDIAGLVLCRYPNNYGCRMVSGGYRWTFTFDTQRRTGKQIITLQQGYPEEGERQDTGQTKDDKVTGVERCVRFHRRTA